MRKYFFSHLEYRQQLVIVFVVGIVLLATLSSIALTYSANKAVKSQLTEQSLYLSESISRQSTLAFLYQSKDEAENVASIALEFPNITGIKLVTDNNILLAKSGEINDATSSFTPDTTELVFENDSFMKLVSPVKTRFEHNDLFDPELMEEPIEGDVLGYVTIVVSKDSLNQVWQQLLKTNFIVSSVVASLLLLILLILTGRLTSPLRKLADVMLRAQSGELSVRASFSGPRDIKNMQQAFNSMISALDTKTRELRIARDQALKTADIKSEFAANVTHELRTPMNSVIGMLDLLSVMDLTSQQVEYVHTAKTSAENLLSLIDNILSYVRSESGKTVIEEKQCNLEEFMTDLISLLSPQAMRKQLDIGYVIDSKIQCILVDVQHLRQILINLLANAIKFTDSGEISVLVQTSNHNAETISFIVRDTGIGIDDKDIASIFDAFTQVDSTSTRKHGGTGLGLAICKQFTSLMAGSLTCQSSLGIGSTFELKIPLRALPSDKNPSLFELPTTVLFCSKSQIVRNFLGQWIEERGGLSISCQSVSELMNALSRLQTDHQAIDYFIFDEDVSALNFSELINVVSLKAPQKQCQSVLLMNSWSDNYQPATENIRVIEKPLHHKNIGTVFFGMNGTCKSDHEILKESITESSSYSKTLKILVVDDNRANCLVAGGMLNQLGIDYDIANNGKEAINKVLRNSYQLILMDCNMPVLDGYEASKTIRKLEGHERNVFILAMTANNCPDEKAKCIDSGMNDLITKPLSIDALNNSLSRLLATEDEQQYTTVGEDSVLDNNALQNLKNSVGDIFTSVINAFIEDIPAYLASLKNAISMRDSQQVFELAHTIKGSASNVGAVQVPEIAKSIENNSIKGDHAHIEKLFVELEASCNRLLSHLSQVIKSEENKHRELGVAIPESADKVLIAEDDRSDRLILANILRTEGYGVTEVTNGQSALATCSRSLPNILLLDAIMPEMDGFSVCKRVRELPNGSDVPILILTSLDDEESISKAFNAGATDYITKPINYSVLKQRVSRLLQTHRAEQHVRKLAYHDTLTNLPNRAYFNQQLRHRISRAKLHSSKLAVLFLDFNRFKLINDSLGHDMGDLLLKAAADRIRNCVRSNDLVARLGGDEFTIILEAIKTPKIVADISTKICDALNEPYVFMNHRLFVSACIGISIYPDDGHSASELLRHSDTAMFKAKETQSDYCFYKPQMEEEIIKKAEFERDVKQAFEDDQFTLHYQPQVSLRTGKIIGLEALVRWNNPEKGFVPAGIFVPVIEEIGMAGKLGSIVLTLTCEQLYTWHVAGINVKIGVNVSGSELQSGKVSKQLTSLIEKCPIPPNLIEIEITESMLMDEPEQVRRELSILKQDGKTIAIDDFGSGFSSLNYLKKFPADVLKIDQEFVKECHVDKADQAIISGIVALAHALDIKVIAEGVENQQQLAILKNIGCDYAQGYFFGKPAPAQEIELMLRSEKVYDL